MEPSRAHGHGEMGLRGKGKGVETGLLEEMDWGLYRRDWLELVPAG